jgi:hypothetical protein
VLFQLLLHFLFSELIKPDYFLDEFFIVEFVTEAFVVGKGGVDSEHDWEFLFHSGPE